MVYVRDRTEANLEGITITGCDSMKGFYIKLFLDKSNLVET